MKKLVLSAVLVNLLAACSIHTPFDSPSAPKQAAAKTEAVESAKVESTPTTGAETKAVDNAATTEAASDAAPNAEATASASGVAEAAPAASNVDPLNDPASPLAKRNVHFPFDVDAIQEADKGTIQAHGAYLAAHLDKKIRVEGNTDERGSSEYNLALGQRRANNTKKALILAGSTSDQIEAISYGEEKPVTTGHDEASWAQNRRADIVYK